jgi:hypothetical protein
MLLDRLAARLEEYVQIQNTAKEIAVPGAESGFDSSSAAIAAIAESMSRGGDEGAEAPPVAGEEAPAHAAPPASQKEEPHVADGK